MRWSRAASTPSLILRRRVGWPTSRQASGEERSRSWLVSMRMPSSWSWSRRWPSSTYADIRISRLMPTPGLCRYRGGGCLESRVMAGFSGVRLWVWSAYSQALEEGEEWVGWPVAAGLGAVGCGAGEGAFFDGEVGVPVDLGRSHVLVAEPQGDDGGVHPGLE